MMNNLENTLQFLDDSEVKKVKLIVEEATTMPRPALPKSWIELRSEKLNAWMMSHTMLGFLTMVVMAIIAAYTKSRPLVDATLVLGLIVQLFGPALLMVAIFAGTLFFWELRKSPFGPFFKLLKSSADMDLPAVHRLAHCDISAIRYVLIY